MNKRTQINLFLARAMGLHKVALELSEWSGEEMVYFQDTDEPHSRISVFCPHTDKAQWAETMAFAFRKGLRVSMQINSIECRFPSTGAKLHYANCFGDDEARFYAATLESIALALGWKEE